MNSDTVPCRPNLPLGLQFAIGLLWVMSYARRCG